MVRVEMSWELSRFDYYGLFGCCSHSDLLVGMAGLTSTLRCFKMAFSLREPRRHVQLKQLYCIDAYGVRKTR